MLQFSLGVTRMDKIRNEYIRGTAQLERFGEKTREARLRWYGHLRKKDDGYIGRRMLRMEFPGKRKRGMPKRRFMDVVKEDMAEFEVMEEDTEDRNNWRRKISCGDPWWEKAERRSDFIYLKEKQCMQMFFVRTSLTLEVAEWVRSLDWWLDGPGFESRFGNFASELWQFRLPNLAKVFRRRH